MRSSLQFFHFLAQESIDLSVLLSEVAHAFGKLLGFTPVIYLYVSSKSFELIDILGAIISFYSQ